MLKNRVIRDIIFVCIKQRGAIMVSYNKLWKLLIDRGMNKSELRKLVGMSSGSLAKLGKNEIVSMDIILRICQSLNCDVGDIMEVIEDID